MVVRKCGYPGCVMYFGDSMSLSGARKADSHLRLLDLARQQVEVALDNLPSEIAEQLSWELAEYLGWGPGYPDDDEENFL